MKTDSLLQMALKYAGHGMAVLPCRKRGKEPLTQHGVKDATENPEMIHTWWARWPKANVALAVPWDHVVVDIDSPAEAEMALQDKGCELPETAIVITANGKHLWYVLPAGVRSRNMVRVLPGLDLRGESGYVLVPPSIHPSGVVYQWEKPKRAIAEAPEWLVELLEEATDSAPAAATPEEWRTLVSGGVEKGRRNDALARLVGHLLRRDVDAIVTLALVRAWNAQCCRPPLDVAEVGRVVGSISGAELRRRGIT